MCDWCHKSGRGNLIPVEGERLCRSCSNLYLDQRFAEGIPAVIDGRETVIRPGYVTPRAHRYR